MKPRIVVLGEKPQGSQWLKYIIDSNLFQVVGGVPRQSNKNIWWDGEVFRDILTSNAIPVFKREQLFSLEYDIIWSIMYGFIIEKELIEKAQLGLNLHESPLPRFRGCNGYSHAILEGEKTYGTTLHIMDCELDRGAIVDQEIFPIAQDETSKELYNRTQLISNMILLRNLSSVAAMKVSSSTVDYSQEKIRNRSSLAELKLLSEEKLASRYEFYNQVRAFDFTPFEPSYIIHEGKKFYFFLNNSLGRMYHNLTIHPLSDVLRLCKDKASFSLSGFSREVIVMEENIYRNYYRIFIPEYSWKK